MTIRFKTTLTLAAALLLTSAAARADTLKPALAATATRETRATPASPPAQAGTIASSYAGREAEAKNLQTFEGGGAGIYIGGSTLVIVLLVVLLIVLL